jgi:hypothetical protein
MMGIRDAIDHAAELIADGHTPHAAAAKVYLKHGKGRRMSPVKAAEKELNRAKAAAKKTSKAFEKADRARAKASAALGKGPKSGPRADALWKKAHAARDALVRAEHADQEAHFAWQAAMRALDNAKAEAKR